MTHPSASPAAWPHVAEVHRGMTFGFYARNGYYGSPEARAQVDKMAALNIKWVCLVATVLQETYASGRQFRDFKMTPRRR